MSSCNPTPYPHFCGVPFCTQPACSEKTERYGNEDSMAVCLALPLSPQPTLFFFFNRGRSFFLKTYLLARTCACGGGGAKREGETLKPDWTREPGGLHRLRLRHQAPRPQPSGENAIGHQSTWRWPEATITAEIPRYGSAPPTSCLRTGEGQVSLLLTTRPLSLGTVPPCPRRPFMMSGKQKPFVFL